MDKHLEVKALAAVRFGAGALLLLAPKRATELFAGAGSASTGGDRMMIRALGIRDVILGIGLLIGLQEGRVRPWLRIGALADGVDAASALMGRGLPASRRWLIVAMAGGAAVHQSQLGEQVD